MTDLTKMTLKEVQDLVHPLNKRVRIYANDGSGDYPIHGALRVYGEWKIMEWTERGKRVVGGITDSDLILTKPTIDWSEMPKDTLVKLTDGSLRYTNGGVCNGEVELYSSDICYIFEGDLTLVKGPIMPHTTNKQPVPDNIEVEVTFYNDKMGTERADAYNWGLDGTESYRIKFWRITGNVV